MDKFLNLEQVKYIALYTGSNSKAQCACKCPYCLLDCWGKREPENGNIGQVYKIFELLPNLRNVFLLGNPDPCIDTDFCNQIAKECNKRNINVVFYTSGIGGVKVLEKLFDGLDKKLSSVSFSLDSLDNNKLAILKGNPNYTIEEITKCFNWCCERKVKSCAYVTVWKLNADDDFNEYYNYCKSHGVSEFTMFVGCNTIDSSLGEEISLEQGIEIRNKYKNIFSIASTVLPKESEFVPICQNKDSGRLFCYLTKDKIMATCCDYFATANPSLFCELQNRKIPLYCKKISQCPCSSLVRPLNISKAYKWGCIHYRSKTNQHH